MPVRAVLLLVLVLSLLPASLGTPLASTEAQQACAGDPGVRLEPSDRSPLVLCAARFVRARLDGSGESEGGADGLRALLAREARNGAERLRGAGCGSEAGALEATALSLSELTRADIAVLDMRPWWEAMSRHLVVRVEADLCLSRKGG